MTTEKNGETIRDLAWFRYNLRRFLRFSEKAARACGVTPQQHQLMLGVAGFAEGGAATISELAEFLQERNNSVVGLVARAAESGLVRTKAGADKRIVVVSLTPRGKRILGRLSRLHHEEAERIRAGFLARRSFERPAPPAAAGAKHGQFGGREPMMAARHAARRAEPSHDK